MRHSTTRKYPQATQLDNRVATPTPNTCWPSGKSRYMKTGSRAMLSTAPSVMPNPASRDMPTLRTRWASTLDSTVGTAPSTMTQKAYCRA